MKRNFARGRVVLTNRSAWVLPCLAGCFFLGAVMGHYMAGLESVYQNQALQKSIASFLTLAGEERMEPASLWYAILSYGKFPMAAYLLGFTVAGVFGIPVLTFYQGAALSFAVSATMYVSGESGFFVVLALFGFRSLFVLPCYLITACDSMRFAMVRLYRKKETTRKTERRYATWRFAFCSMILLFGAAGEHMFLAEWLKALL